ncbi:MAG: UvrD-helicase domain-containing protein [Dongiaceae bacterium]
MTAAPDSQLKDDANRAQRRAADPRKSVWVGASAGSGKTKVLTDRALALMMAGTPPHRLLCLTFTKAAAAEMANRLAHRLTQWAAAGDAALGEDLFELTGRAAEAEDLHRARRLFARVLECPGGMKIQTIHAFCQSLLRRFPLEAGIPPYFEPLDERSAAEQMLAARETVLAEARAGRAPAVSAALGTVTALIGEAEFGELLQALAAERGRVAAALAAGPEALARRLRARLGVAPGAPPRGCWRPASPTRRSSCSGCGWPSPRSGPAARRTASAATRSPPGWPSRRCGRAASPAIAAPSTPRRARSSPP